MKDIKNKGILVGTDNTKEPKLINYDPESKNNITLAVSGSGINLNEEMGEKAVKKYLKIYFEEKKTTDGFIKAFQEYVNSRKKTKNGYKRISANGFRMFIMDPDTLKLIKEVIEHAEEYNNSNNNDNE